MNAAPATIYKIQFRGFMFRFDNISRSWQWSCHMHVHSREIKTAIKFSWDYYEFVQDGEWSSGYNTGRIVTLWELKAVSDTGAICFLSWLSQVNIIFLCVWRSFLGVSFFLLEFCYILEWGRSWSQQSDFAQEIYCYGYRMVSHEASQALRPFQI